MVHAWNNAVWRALEEYLVPPLPSFYYATLLKNSLAVVGLLPLGIMTSMLVGVHKVCSFVVSYFRSPVTIDPKKNFQAVVDDSRLWSQIGTEAEIEKELIENPSGLPEPAIEGVGTATFQDSPLFCPDSQWAVDGWQQKIPEAHRPGRNSNLFELYQRPEGRQGIIQRLKQLNVTHYRFSIEWSHLEPKEGEWRDDNMEGYIALCKDLRDAGIDPTITLLHFSEPKWFHAKGSFEEKENIQHFENFAVKVFNRLTQVYKDRPLVEWFCTINEPEIDAFSRYIMGTFSPGFFMRFAKAGNFLKNALEAHCVVYERLKQSQLLTVKVGIIHQHMRMRPTNSLVIPVVRYLTRLMNEVPMNFFRSKGKFDFKVPFFCNVQQQSSYIPKTDFIGVQYYVRPWIGFAGPTSYGEPMTKMPYHEDPAGIYEAIKETHEAYNAPVLVTETGISTENDAQRSRFMLRARYAIREAAKDLGVKNVLGVSWWCLGDNMELERGMTQPFGLYALTGRGLALTPKPGTHSSIKVAEAWRSRQKLLF